MSLLQSIPVRVETSLQGGTTTGNLEPLLRQIEEALAELVENGNEAVIDLAAMPFTEQDERELRAQLGEGEVNAVIQAFGPTVIEETAFPGVWLVEHKDAESRRLTLHVEIAPVPKILTAPADDLVDSLAALHRFNKSLQTPGEDVR